MEASAKNRPRPGGLLVANPVGTIEGPGIQEEDVKTPHQYGLHNNDLEQIHTLDDGTVVQAGPEKSSTLQKKKTFMDDDSDIE